MNEDDRMKVLIEHVDDKFDLVMEAVKGNTERLDRVDSILDSMDERLTNIETIIAPMTLGHKAKIIDLEHTTDNHETRIMKLESQTV